MDSEPPEAREKEAQDAPTGDLRQRLAAASGEGTPGGRALAHYLLANLSSLPFETAASVAAKVGVSEASVGRFCRSIGYRHLKDLKGSLQVDLGDKAWLIGDRLQGFPPPQPGGQRPSCRGRWNARSRRWSASTNWPRRRTSTPR